MSCQMQHVAPFKRGIAVPFIGEHSLLFSFILPPFSFPHICPPLNLLSPCLLIFSAPPKFYLSLELYTISAIIL